MRYLTANDLKTLVSIAKKAIAAKVPGFYGWKNPPIIKDGVVIEEGGNTTMTIAEALARYKEKLDGAYGERAALTIAYLCAAVKAGKRVAFLQRKNDATLPFDAEGWVEVSVETFPLFHLAPWDLPLDEVAAAGLMNVIAKGTSDDIEHGWKKTDKPTELAMVLDWIV